MPTEAFVIFYSYLCEIKVSSIHSLAMMLQILWQMITHYYIIYIPNTDILPFMVIASTFCGWINFCKSILIFLATIIIRDTLIPPPVEPALAPTNISKNKMILEKVGHRLKSQLEYPVVVIIDPTWKEE